MDNELLTDHAYDGIQEYDNPLPGWWTYTFVATIFQPRIPPVVSRVRRVAAWKSSMKLRLGQNARLQFGVIGDLQGTRKP